MLLKVVEYRLQVVDEDKFLKMEALEDRFLLVRAFMSWVGWRLWAVFVAWSEVEMFSVFVALAMLDVVEDLVEDVLLESWFNFFSILDFSLLKVFLSDFKAVISPLLLLKLFSKFSFLTFKLIISFSLILLSLLAAFFSVLTLVISFFKISSSNSLSLSFFSLLLLAFITAINSILAFSSLILNS